MLAPLLSRTGFPLGYWNVPRAACVQMKRTIKSYCWSYSAKIWSHQFLLPSSHFSYLAAPGPALAAWRFTAGRPLHVTCRTNNRISSITTVTLVSVYSGSVEKLFFCLWNNRNIVFTQHFLFPLSNWNHRSISFMFLIRHVIHAVCVDTTPMWAIAVQWGSWTHTHISPLSDSVI